ncbi:hypothetical protein J6590_092746 [Homalodisca vitripennis]|nr:hypothetical protein J6590_092746 [Homalodisca vitripennis]
MRVLARIGSPLVPKQETYVGYLCWRNYEIQFLPPSLLLGEAGSLTHQCHFICIAPPPPYCQGHGTSRPVLSKNKSVRCSSRSTARLSEERAMSAKEMDQVSSDQESTEWPLEPTLAEAKADTEVPGLTPTCSEMRCQKRPLVLLERTDLEEAKRTRLEQALVPNPDPLTATSAQHESVALRPEAGSLVLAASGKTSKKGPPKSKGETTPKPEAANRNGAAPNTALVTEPRNRSAPHTALVAAPDEAKSPVTSIGDEGTRLPVTSMRDEGVRTKTRTEQLTSVLEKLEALRGTLSKTTGVATRNSPNKRTGTAEPKGYYCSRPSLMTLTEICKELRQMLDPKRSTSKPKPKPPVQTGSGKSHNGAGPAGGTGPHPQGEGKAEGGARGVGAGASQGRIPQGKKPWKAKESGPDEESCYAL